MRFLDVAIALLLEEPVEDCNSSASRGGVPARQLIPAGGADAALAGAGGRGDVWANSHDNNRKRYIEVCYEMAHRMSSASTETLDHVHVLGARGRSAFSTGR